MNTKKVAEKLGLSASHTARLTASYGISCKDKGCMGIPHKFSRKDVSRSLKSRKALKSRAEKDSVSGLAKRLGVTAQTIRRHIRKNGAQVSPNFFATVWGRLVIDETNQRVIARSLKKKLVKRLPKAPAQAPDALG